MENIMNVNYVVLNWVCIGYSDIYRWMLMVFWVYGGELECCILIWGSDGKYIKFFLCMMFWFWERFF